MMKLTNIQLLDSMSAIQILGANTQIKAQASYKIMKATGKLEDAVKAFDKTRKILIDRHAARDESGAMIYADKEQTQVQLCEPAVAMKEHQDLMEAETDDLGISSIKIEDLGDIMVAPAILKSLNWMIVE